MGVCVGTPASAASAGSQAGRGRETWAQVGMQAVQQVQHRVRIHRKLVSGCVGPEIWAVPAAARGSLLVLPGGHQTWEHRMAGPMLHPPPRLALTVPRRGCWRSRSEGLRMCLLPDALQAAGRRAGGAALQPFAMAAQQATVCLLHCPNGSAHLVRRRHLARGPAESAAALCIVLGPNCSDIIPGSSTAPKAHY